MPLTATATSYCNALLKQAGFFSNLASKIVKAAPNTLSKIAPGFVDKYAPKAALLPKELRLALNSVLRKKQLLKYSKGARRAFKREMQKRNQLLAKLQASYSKLDSVGRHNLQVNAGQFRRMLADPYRWLRDYDTKVWQRAIGYHGRPGDGSQWLLRKIFDKENKMKMAAQAAKKKLEQQAAKLALPARQLAPAGFRYLNNSQLQKTLAQASRITGGAVSQKAVKKKLLDRLMELMKSHPGTTGAIGGAAGGLGSGAALARLLGGDDSDNT